MNEENKIELIENNDFLEQPEDNKKDELMKEGEPKDEEKEKSIIEEEKEDINEDNEIQEDDEKKALISQEEKKEKERLIGIIDRLKVDLDSEEFESLGQIYEQYLNNEDMTKRTIKPGTNRKSLCVMFYFVSPVFCIINLMGVFQSITMLKIIAQILKNAIKNYFKSLMKNTDEIEKFSINDYLKEYEYYSLFVNDVMKEVFDFNLTMLMAFLGDALLEAKGFRKSFSAFAILNVVAMILILNFSFEEYDRDENTYSLFKMLYMVLIWLLLFVGVGASALLSQQVIIESNYKYDEYIRKLNEESKKKLKMKKDKIKQKKQEKEKYKETQSSDFQKELDNVKDIGLDSEETTQKGTDDQIKIDDQIKTDEQKEKEELKEKEDKNGDHNILTVNPEISLEFNEDNDKYKIKKKKSQEINIRGIAKDFYDIKNEDQYLIRAQTLTTSNIISKKYERNKKIHKKKSIKEAKPEKKKKSKFNSFFMVCITTILGYFLKYILNITLIREGSKTDKEYQKYLVDIINQQSIGKKCNQTEPNEHCIKEFFEDKNLSKNDSILFENLISMVSNSDYSNKITFYFIVGLYIASFILSLILYSIFVCIFEKNKKKQNVNGDKYSVCEICGYTIYSEDKIVSEPPKCECCQLLCCGTCQNCLNMITGSVLCCLDENEKEEVSICHCCKCCDQDKINYDKKKEFFCYCYQAKRKQNWFNQFLTSDTQKKIFPFMLEYFYLQFLTIAFEYQQSQRNEKQDFYDFQDYDGFKFFGIFIGTFFLFFYSTLSFNTISKIMNEKTQKSLNLIKQVSQGILAGAHGILIFNGLFSLIVSSLYLSKKYEYLFNSQDLLLVIFVPILMNKFYHFTLTFFCVSYSDQKKKFEVISGSTLISIYLSIWDLIISLIRDHASEKALYIVQIVFSSLPSLVFLIFISTLFFGGIFKCGESCRDRFEIYFCLFSFCLCFGGFWFSEETYDKLLERNCECCEIDCYYCFECCDYCSCDCCNYCSCDCCECCDCCDCFLCCECCDCCVCYDCCGCCDCFYCCGDECLCNC